MSSWNGSKYRIPNNNGSLTSNRSIWICMPVRLDVKPQKKIKIPPRTKVHGISSPLHWKCMGVIIPMSFQYTRIVSH